LIGMCIGDDHILRVRTSSPHEGASPRATGEQRTQRPEKARFMVRVSSRLDSRVSKFVYVHSEQFDLVGAN
jgi:hypothetical protein